MKKQTWRVYLEVGGFAQCCRCNNQLVIEVVDGRDMPVCMSCSRVEYGYMEHEAGFVQELQRRMHADDHWMIVDILSIARMHVRELAQCEQCSERMLATVQVEDYLSLEDAAWDRDDIDPWD